jgi:hypothetical protein
MGFGGFVLGIWFRLAFGEDGWIPVCEWQRYTRDGE